MHKSSVSDDELRLKAIIETATDAIIIIDERGLVELANEAAFRLFGYTREELVGQNIALVMPEPHRSRHDEYIKRYCDTGHKKIIGIGREVEGRSKDGAVFPIRLSVSEVKLQDKRIFAGIIHDLSEQRAAESRIIKLNAELEQRVEMRTEELANAVNQLLKINKKLEREIREREAAEMLIKENETRLKEALQREKELSELKSRFVSMASHEFRTPLSTILSSADLIEAYVAGEQQPKREKHVKRVKSAVATLTGILNDFLSLSRLEEGQIVTEPVHFQLHSFCDEITDEIHSLLKPGQRIVHLIPKEPVTLFLDKKFLKNIFFNLLSNAIKYSNADLPIECETTLKEDKLCIRITDQGIGIPEEEQQHLFTRFFRAHNVENIQGTGLGLNIVKRYVELMKGAISFESELSKGTTFFVEIPLVPEKNDL